MSEARRRRRQMERAFGFKAPKNPLSPEAKNLRERKIKAAEEIRRQNLEKDINSNRKKNKPQENSSGISLNLPEDDSNITLERDPFEFLSKGEDEKNK